MLKGFNQIKVHEDSVPKLTITTPFGILNGSSTFSRAVYMAMQPFLGTCVVTYIDDCTAFGNDFKDHFRDLKAIFMRLRDVKMTLNSNKCMLFQDNVDLLGFNISKEGIRPLPEKIAKITHFPRPVNETGVCAFVNLAGFYRNHVNNYTELVNPMLELLKKKNKFEWSENCGSLFKKLKQAIIKSATLGFPNPLAESHLFCDASDIGIESVLSQLDQENKYVPICFYQESYSQLKCGMRRRKRNY